MRGGRKVKQGLECCMIGFFQYILRYPPSLLDTAPSLLGIEPLSYDSWQT